MRLFLFSASLGGTLGLFLGASIVSIAEFLEFLFELFLFKGKRNGTQINVTPAYQSK